MTTGHNPVFSRIDEHTASVSDSVALRIYSSTKPFNQKIADLQKGLVFVYNGAEVIGEGTGFGVPILKYSDETYFSSLSALYARRQGNLTIIRKDFLVDVASRDVFRNVKLKNRKARTVIDYLSDMYQKHKHLRFLTMKGLLFRLGVHTNFAKVPSRGTVTMIYKIRGERILVETDFSLTDRTSLRKIFILNEQSSLFFRVYSDSDGLRLTDENIGAWDEVRAQWATIGDSQSKVGFSLKKERDSILRRGREYIKGSMDWVGLDYEVDPNSNMFRYEIRITEG
jgi:hypothetical protein